MTERKPRRPKTPAPTRELVEQPHGGALLPGGIPGHPGTGGRPTNEFRQRMREAADRGDVAGFLERTVRGEERGVIGVVDGVPVEGPPRFSDRLEAASLLIEHGHGKAPQKLEVEAPERQETGEQNIARLVVLLPRVIAHLPIDQRELLKWLKRGKAREELLVSGRTVGQKEKP